MKQPRLIQAGIFILVVFSAGFAAAQTGTISPESPPDAISPAWAFRSESLLRVPVSASEIFGVGATLLFSADWLPARVPGLMVGGGGSYSLLPVKAENSLSIIGVGADLGYFFRIAPRLDMRFAAAGGYQYYLLNNPEMAPPDGTTSEGGGFIRLNVGLEFLLGQSWNLGFTGGYEYDFGLSHQIIASLNTSYLLGNNTTRLQRIDEARGGEGRTPAPGEGIRIDKLELTSVFPVFHKYYDDHPLGTAILYNQEDAEITDIELTFFVKQYMDNPKSCPAPTTLAPNEMSSVDLIALFNDGILSITEATKVTAEVDLRYRINGRLYADKQGATLRVYDRNAMTWDDDRRAAAFVTAKDPMILELSKKVAGVVRACPKQPVNELFLKAMAFHEALNLIGIEYVVDPQTPYADLSRTADAIDFLQFPRQTLQYSAGDCDDLSILYCALLESVGVETAFITVPGHIFMAFSPDLSSQEASKCISRVNDLIVLNNRVWIPIEVTARGSGFTKAWELGAKQWNEHVERGQARLYPIHEAWTVYEPVGLPGQAKDTPELGSELILETFERQVDLFIEGEIRHSVERLENQIQSSGGNPKHYNALGVLYARYGMMEKAAEQFQEAARRADYAPALVNLGNLKYLEEDWNNALSLYQKAAQLIPEDLRVQICIARTHHELGNYDEATNIYQRVRREDPVLGERYAYLGGTGEQDSRADESVSRGEALWID